MRVTEREVMGGAKISNDLVASTPFRHLESPSFSSDITLALTVAIKISFCVKKSLKLLIKLLKHLKLLLKLLIKLMRERLITIHEIVGRFVPPGQIASFESDDRNLCI